MESKEAVILSEKIVRYLLGLANEKEKKEVEEWAKSSEDNIRLMKEILNDLKYNKDLSTYSDNESLIHARNLNAWKIIKVSILGKYRIKRIKRISYAAAVVALLVTGGFIFSEIVKRRELIKTTTMLSSIKPGDDKATLYTENGGVIYLDSIDKKVIDTLKNITVNRKTLSYNTLTQDRPKKISKKKLIEVYNKLVVPKGGKYHLVLSDSSQVWLNSGSTLSYYVYGVDSQRVVYLSGEAYFEIRKDPTKPFKVISGNNTLKVLGTEFNVEAYSDRYVNTTLVNGSVQVSLSDSDRYVVLDSPGLRAEADHLTNSIKTRKVDYSLFTSWKDGIFKFNNTDLEEMIVILSRWYNFEYKIINKTNKKYHFSGSFNRFDDLQTVIKIIEYTGIPIDIESKGNTLVINI